MSKQWFVARTKTGSEHIAAVAITGKGFDTFLPMHLVRRSHARRVETVNRPLFPRYLFVAFDPATDGYGEINWCRGVASRGLIVTASGEPIAVPAPVIDRIRGDEAAMRARAGEITTGYQPGDIFKIAIGQFADIEAAYLGEENGKVWATVHLFGASHVVDLPFEAVPCKKTLDSRAA